MRSDPGRRGKAVDMMLQVTIVVVWVMVVPTEIAVWLVRGERTGRAPRWLTAPQSRWSTGVSTFLVTSSGVIILAAIAPAESRWLVFLVVEGVSVVEGGLAAWLTPTRRSLDRGAQVRRSRAILIGWSTLPLLAALFDMPSAFRNAQPYLGVSGTILGGLLLILMILIAVVLALYGLRLLGQTTGRSMERQLEGTTFARWSGVYLLVSGGLVAALLILELFVGPVL
jgi:hypothetical protein